MSPPARAPRAPGGTGPLLGFPGRRQRAHTSLSSKLDLDSAFFWLLLTFLITAFTFLSLRDHHSLNAAQLAEYERRTQYLSNSSVYIVEAARPERLLSTLSASEWRRVAHSVDLVAFVFDDLPLFLTDGWVAAAESTLDLTRPQIALFRCGCVLRAGYFATTGARLGGLECVLLPGFVFGDSDVKWMDVAEGRECRARTKVLAARGPLRAWAPQLADVRRDLAAATPSNNVGVARPAPAQRSSGNAVAAAAAATAVVAAGKSVSDQKAVSAAR